METQVETQAERSSFESRERAWREVKVATLAKRGW